MRQRRVTALPVRGPKLADEAYDLILDQLITLKLPPGARITVDELARQFGISQTPIREALGRLKSDGLVTKTHLIGYRVTPQWTREQFQQLYEIRLLLEPAAARLAAAKISSQDAGSLERFVSDMEQAVSDEKRVNYGHFALHDSEFHDRIARASGNELIVDALSRLHAHMHIFRLYFHAWVTESAIAEHEAIVAAIVARNPDEAEHAMRSHIEESWNRLQKGF
ncbi:GntR family transcriptional regulator [Aureimonas fodinaquatilis]|uniref:GntR family transcriptional regulator n=1 Tax=Aureimonas fodinaquatilis TaxID=2565783 RepID=A0A5B0DZK2_9HYPH|nr:GntR family transcriptional regulator [Aureimonas fodinaquatilis]KAA0971973.1 GntR family transcriptional regulator [Aureimonas fodinaquatilis]